MTQLQIIEQEFKKLHKGPVLIRLWREDVEAGNIVRVIAKIKLLIKEESPQWYIDNLGETLVDLIIKFNPVVQAEIMLEELSDLWQHKWKVNKQSRDFSAMIKLNKDIATLFEMSKL